MKTFWENITITEIGCWEWNGSRHPKGYGLFFKNNRTHMAHRFAYESYNDVRLLPDMDVHHICKNKKCICPIHTEVVPHNNHPDSASGGNITKTHCKNGHAFIRTNTYVRILPSGKTHRMCRSCRAEGMAMLAKARLESLK